MLLIMAAYLVDLEVTEEEIRSLVEARIALRIESGS